MSIIGEISEHLDKILNIFDTGLYACVYTVTVKYPVTP